MSCQCCETSWECSGWSVFLPLSNPDITEREIELVNAVLRTPCLSMGPMLERFEEAMVSYVGAKHAVGVSSGTAGLHLAVIAAGIGEGDLVITTPFSFVASANCILYQWATPIFVGIDPDKSGKTPYHIREVPPAFLT